jgi:hypothetical protein
MRSFLVSMWLVLVLPSGVQAKVIAWDGKPISVSISAERLTRVEFPENLRSVFLSRSDIAVEREDALRPGAGARRSGCPVRCRRQRNDVRDKSLHRR